VIYALAAFGVFLVYRWWALLPAAVPVVITVYLHTMTDYAPLWREESVGPSPDQPALYILFVIVAILLQALGLSAGLLMRAIWERVRP
jgi:hypothetical protein